MTGPERYFAHLNGEREHAARFGQHSAGQLEGIPKRRMESL
jgi:hypothetical protein